MTEGQPFGQGRPIDRTQYQRPKLVSGIQDEIWDAYKTLAMIERRPVGMIVNEVLKEWIERKGPVNLIKETKHE